MKILKFGLVLLIFGLCVIRLVPNLLFWQAPCSVHGYTVYSYRANCINLLREVGVAHSLRMSGPIPAASSKPNIYIADGGLVWSAFALFNTDSFAVSFPIPEYIVVRQVSHDEEWVQAGDDKRRRRRLHAILAHELAHADLRSYFGVISLIGKPAWLIEGYCDMVANDSTITPQEAMSLRLSGQSDPALKYIEGRMYIQRVLKEKNLNPVDLFNSH